MANSSISEHPNLLNEYCFWLNIDIKSYTKGTLTRNLLVEQETPIKSLKLSDIYRHDDNQVEITCIELNKLYYLNKSITLFDRDTNVRIKFTTENGGMTVADLLNCILEFFQ